MRTWVISPAICGLGRLAQIADREQRPTDPASVPPPDLPPSVVFLMYPSCYMVPFHDPNSVTGKPFVPTTMPAGVYPSP